MRRVANILLATQSPGEAPNIHILDNKFSRDVKKISKEDDVEYQLVPPHIHRRNAVKCAIRTYKNHLIAGLYTCDPKSPSREWDRLLSQCNITINLLRSARHNPSLSEYATLLRNFNFNATAMVTHGTKVVVHEKTKRQVVMGRTWN